jgi:Zn-dependent protease with chaperone function
MDKETAERLDRLQMEVSQLREFAAMQLAVIQVMALKMGIAPQQMAALSPKPIPTPFDLMDMLKPKG